MLTLATEKIARLADEVYRIDESGHMARISLELDLSEDAVNEDESSSSLDIAEATEPDANDNPASTVPKTESSESAPE